MRFDWQPGSEQTIGGTISLWDETTRSYHEVDFVADLGLTLGAPITLDATNPRRRPTLTIYSQQTVNRTVAEIAVGGTDITADHTTCNVHPTIATQYTITFNAPVIR